MKKVDSLDRIEAEGRKPFGRQRQRFVLTQTCWAPVCQSNFLCRASQFLKLRYFGFVATLARAWILPVDPPSGDGSYIAHLEKLLCPDFLCPRCHRATKKRYKGFFKRGLQANESTLSVGSER